MSIAIPPLASYADYKESCARQAQRFKGEVIGCVIEDVAVEHILDSEGPLGSATITVRRPDGVRLTLWVSASHGGGQTEGYISADPADDAAADALGGDCGHIWFNANAESDEDAMQRRYRYAAANRH